MSLIYQFLSPIRTILDAVNNRKYKQMIIDALSPLLVDNSLVLDIGCSDGYLAGQLITKNKTLRILGADIQYPHKSQIPCVIYDGRHLPFPNCCFDVVMAVDVLHHTEDIPAMIFEMSRVSRRDIFIKDHVWDGKRITWLFLCAFDWCTNAPNGIRCYYNYPRIDQWQRLFKAVGLDYHDSMLVSNFPFQMTKKFNQIFKLSKI